MGTVPTEHEHDWVHIPERDQLYGGLVPTQAVLTFFCAVCTSIKVRNVDYTRAQQEIRHGHQ